MNDHMTNINMSNINQMSTFQKIRTLQELLKIEKSLRSMVVTSHSSFQRETEGTITKIIEEQIKLIQNTINYITNTKTLFSFHNHFTYIRKHSFEIRKILLFLRHNQNYIFNLLTILKQKEDLIQIARLIGNSFYSNYFSSDSIEEEYLLLLSRTLKYEIDNMETTNNPNDFLSQLSINSHLLDHLINRIDVKSFFIKVLKKIVTLIDYNDDKRTISFDINAICHKINEENQNLMTGSNELNVNVNENVSVDMDFNKVIDLQQSFFVETLYDIKNNNVHKLGKEKFFNNYLPDLTRKMIVTRIESSNTNMIMKEYLSKQLVEMKNNNNYFCNSQFIGQIYISNYPADVLNKYYNNFANTIELIDDILNQLFTNMDMIPSSIRYVAKIILYCLHKKFPNIAIVDRNAILSRFFFEKLMEPVLLHLDVNGLSHVISHSTQNTISILTKIIRKMVYANLFNMNDDSSYTVFNWYFLEKMPFIVSFFDKLTNIDLPPIIKTILDNNDNNKEKVNFDVCNYKYDYFKENPNEDVYNVSICYTVNQLKIIIETILENKNIFLNNKSKDQDISEFIFAIKAVSMDYIRDLLNRDNINKCESYIYLNECIYRKSISEINDYTNSSFALNEIPNNDKENILIKTKNSLCAILTSFADIPKTTFFGNSITTFESFINALVLCKNLQYNKITDKNETFWNIQTLVSFYKQLNTLYTQNDCSLLLKELLDEINSSIQSIKVNTVTHMKSLQQTCNIIHRELLKMVKRVNQVESNHKILTFIEKTIVPSQIIIFDKKEFDFKLKNRSSTNKNDKIERKSSFFGKRITEKFNCQNINDFISFFPNLNDYIEFIPNKPLPKKKSNFEGSVLSQTIAEWNSINVFTVAECFRIPKVFNEYFGILGQLIRNGIEIGKDGTLSSSNVNKDFLINAKKIISEYVLDKVYGKIFPSIQLDRDVAFNDMCKRYVKKEFKEFPGGIEVDINFLIPIAMQLFENLDEARNPNSKIQILSKITDIVHKQLNLLVLDMAFDTFFAGLAYIVVKSKTKQLPSNIYYIKLYLDNANSNKVVSDFNSVIEFIMSNQEQHQQNMLNIEDDHDNEQDKNDSNYEENLRIN